MTKYLTNREAAQAFLDGKKLLWNGSPVGSCAINFAALDAETAYTLAPQTITRTITYPTPETVAPGIDTVYYSPDPQREAFFSTEEWKNDEMDNRWLSRGLVYLSKDDAIARAKEMLK